MGFLKLQLPLFSSYSGAASEKLVNVASVPQRSPFRYPGGKTWLQPRIRSWMNSLRVRPEVFIEPFAGGGSIGLTVAFENLAQHVVLCELDRQVAAVWETILLGEAEWLAERILSFELTHDSAKEILSQAEGSVREQAFRTILRNRTFHGGILASGATFVKHGENGRGLQSRWYPETLARRIRAIAAIRERFAFVQQDGLALMDQYASQKQAAFFIDPPYTAGGRSGKRAGTRLYTHHELDHERLFELAAGVAGTALLTYDDAPDVRALAARHSFDVECVAMKNTHHAKLTELLIAKDLRWMR